MFFDKVQGPWMLGALVLGIPALIGGWYLVRNRVTAAAQDDSGQVGEPATAPAVDLEE
jgi:L-asparagine permease